MYSFIERFGRNFGSRYIEGVHQGLHEDVVSDDGGVSEETVVDTSACASDEEGRTLT